MVISISIIVLVLVTQNSLQVTVNPKCHPDNSKGIICLRKEAMDIYEHRENLRFSNPKASLNYPEKMHESSSTEDVIASYEGIHNFPEKNDNSQAIGEVRTQYLPNFQDQNYQLYSDGSESFDSSKNPRVSVALVKSENEENVRYKSSENLRNFSELTDISDGKSEFEPLNHLRNALNKNRNSVKYDNYESIRNQLDKNKWHVMPLNSEKRFLGAIIKGVGSLALEISVGKLIDTIFN